MVATDEPLTAWFPGGFGVEFPDKPYTSDHLFRKVLKDIKDRPDLHGDVKSVIRRVVANLNEERTYLFSLVEECLHKDGQEAPLLFVLLLESQFFEDFFGRETPMYWLLTLRTSDAMVSEYKTFYNIDRRVRMKRVLGQAPRTCACEHCTILGQDPYCPQHHHRWINRNHPLEQQVVGISPVKCPYDELEKACPKCVYECPECRETYS